MKRILPLPIAVIFACWVAASVSIRPAAAETDHFIVGEHGLVKYPNVGALCPAQGVRVLATEPDRRMRTVHREGKYPCAFQLIEAPRPVNRLP